MDDDHLALAKAKLLKYQKLKREFQSSSSHVGTNGTSSSQSCCDLIINDSTYAGFKNALYSYNSSARSLSEFENESNKSYNQVYEELRNDNLSLKRRLESTENQLLALNRNFADVQKQLASCYSLLQGKDSQLNYYFSLLQQFQQWYNESQNNKSPSSKYFHRASENISQLNSAINRITENVIELCNQKDQQLLSSPINSPLKMEVSKIATKMSTVSVRIDEPICKDASASTDDELFNGAVSNEESNSGSSDKFSNVATPMISDDPEVLTSITYANSKVIDELKHALNEAVEEKLNYAARFESANYVCKQLSDKVVDLEAKLNSEVVCSNEDFGCQASCRDQDTKEGHCQTEFSVENNCCNEHLSLIHALKDQLEQERQLSVRLQEDQEGGKLPISNVSSSFRSFSREQLETLLINSASTISQLRQRNVDLDNVVTLLQGENDTIGDYVSLYLRQKELLVRQFQDKESLLKMLLNERTKIQNMTVMLKKFAKQMFYEQSDFSHFACHEDDDKNNSKENCDIKQFVTVRTNAVENFMNFVDSINLVGNPCSPAFVNNSLCLCSQCSGAVYQI